MRLHVDDFVAFRANWEDKAANLRALAGELGLGTDSFVFLDDNPIERAWVRAQVPDVAVVELGASVFSYRRDVDAGRWFYAFEVTDEDRARTAQYRGEAGRRALQATYASVDEFLSQLAMQGAVAPVSAANMARVAQLVNKTNQFNLTGRRRSAADIAALLGRPGTWGAAFSLSDLFGDHGLVSVVLCDAPVQGTWEIDTWVMSCRVLGRQMERFVIDQVVHAARDAGVTRILGTFHPTARNGLVATLYDDLGFTRVDVNGEIRYAYDVAPSSARLPHPIRLHTTVTRSSR
jgi:FkbH-like protein